MPEDFEFIQYRKANRIAYVTINRPDVMNAMHPPANAEMDRAWHDFEADDDTWVAIVTGAGDRAFCAGMDLRWRADPMATGVAMPQSGFGGLTNPRYAKITKPIIAAVNGYCLGGGLEMAMACDLVVAADSAQFGLPEVKRGIVAGGGGPHRLPRQIPFRVAMGYLLTGRHFSAAEAERWGLINEVVPQAQVMEAAERWANEILDGAPLSVRAMRQMALEGIEMPLEEAYNGSYSALQKLIGSEDSREGPRAFAEKRKPVWTGR
ncbi:MAG TPA: enoyl-CoA hydratase-related protein [Dehalococcoidia bacterium]|nr:enoyl-CoA hydratase-related protein [Dehalococcoidia bacterium]